MKDPNVDRPRRLADWLNPTGGKEGPFIGGQGLQAKELGDGLARVKRNEGAGGVDGQSLADFEEQLDEQLDRLHEELRDDTYQPLPVRQQLDPQGRPAGQVSPARHSRRSTIGCANRRC